MPVLGGNAIDHGFAYAGQVADLQLCNVVSKLNKDTATIPYGYGVITDGDDGAVLPTATSVATEFVGIVMRELNRAYRDGDVFGAPVDYDMSVVTHGVVWVEAFAAVDKDDPVFLMVGAGNEGKFTNVVGAGATLAVEIAGAKWVSTATAGNLAKISLGLGG